MTNERFAARLVVHVLLAFCVGMIIGLAAAYLKRIIRPAPDGNKGVIADASSTAFIIVAVPVFLIVAGEFDQSFPLLQNSPSKLY